MKYYDITTNGFYEEMSDGRIEISDETWQDLLEKQAEGGKIQAINGSVVCVMPTNEEISAGKDAAKKATLQIQIDALDVKSIRALREGGLKDEATGQTWVEYYTAQIAALRAEIASL